MKPSVRQKKVCETLKQEIEYWQTTNDITSPTLDCEIEDNLYAELEDVIDDRLRHQFEKTLEKLLELVRKAENDKY